MKITCGGVRGSLPVSGKDFLRYGGQTTSFWVESNYFPAGETLVVDAGSGILGSTRSIIQAGIKTVVLVQTHYHDDHLIGLPFSRIVSPAVNCRVHVYGPLCHADGPRGEVRPYGPREALQHLFCRPRFPVPFSQYERRIMATAIADPLQLDWGSASQWALVFHPTGGRALLQAASLVKTAKLPGGIVPISQCVVVTFLYNHHPQRALSLRIEERPTGAVAVIMTDHENTSSITKEMEQHLRGAQLLLADCQYSEGQYHHCVGYGHGSPHYWVRVARQCQLSRVGFIHHDPNSTDEQVEAIVREARLCARTAKAKNLSLFACCEGQGHILK